MKYNGMVEFGCNEKVVVLLRKQNLNIWVFGAGTLFLVGCGTSRGPSIQVPTFLDIKSVQFSLGVNYAKTLSPQSHGKEIQEILSMLDNARVVGYEKLPLPEGGYPATVAFDLNVGHDFSVGLARVSDDTVTRGLPNYLDYFGSDKPIRLFSPEIYHWLINGGN